MNKLLVAVRTHQISVHFALSCTHWNSMARFLSCTDWVYSFMVTCMGFMSKFLVAVVDKSACLLKFVSVLDSAIVEIPAIMPISVYIFCWPNLIPVCSICLCVLFVCLYDRQPATYLSYTCRSACCQLCIYACWPPAWTSIDTCRTSFGAAGLKPGGLVPGEWHQVEQLIPGHDPF